MSLSQYDALFTNVRQAKSVQDACYALSPLFDQYKVISLGLTRGSIFWRARPCGSSPWATVAEMGPPPANKTVIGRLNDDSRPVLYAAVKEDTALAEVYAAPGQLFQLIGYRVLLDEEIVLAVIGEMMHVYKLGYMRFTGSDPDSTLAGLINQLGTVHGKQLLYIDAFLHQILADPKARDNQYILSRAVAAMILRDAKIDGIAYPSAQDPLGYNITLKPQIAEKKIHPSSCFQCRINEVREFGFVEYSVLQEAERLDEAGHFIWQPPLSSGHRRFFNLTELEYKIGMSNKDDPSAFMHMKRAHQSV